jgi:hypothetical protein
MFFVLGTLCEVATIMAQRIGAYLVPLAFGLISFGCGGHDNPIASCLPKGIKLSTPLNFVSGEPTNAKNETVGSRLKRLGANVRDGKLYDASGKEIRIHVRHFDGTYGSNQDADKAMEWHRKEVQELEKHYTVVEVQIHGK